MTLAEEIDIAYFPEASSDMTDGPYDMGLVEGSITTRHDAERIHQMRRAIEDTCDHRSVRHGRRNSGLTELAQCEPYGSARFMRNPNSFTTLSTSTPIAEHVPVDFELRGCPINKHQLLELLAAKLAVGCKPNGPYLQRLHGMQAAR